MNFSTVIDWNTVEEEEDMMADLRAIDHWKQVIKSTLEKHNCEANVNVIELYYNMFSNLEQERITLEDVQESGYDLDVLEELQDIANDTAEY